MRLCGEWVRNDDDDGSAVVVLDHSRHIYAGVSVPKLTGDRD